ncbi:ATP synthase F1 subunit delta [Candidatus Sarmatiella mevalonica]|uniref:ATP synthase F1 subunit delta n=1 Tax=Candidatus Sarmatiella mevalonica TaxID=2770581 RepID=UPI0019221B28|nr:ATP synthase F1 subunit delta [Candidatus Sarmatiella mevalonica]
MLKNYAKALLDYAMRNKLETQIEEQFRCMVSSIMNNRELNDVLGSKAITKSSKSVVLTRVMTQCKFDGGLIRFFTLLIKHERIAMLDQIYTSYQNLARASSGKEKVIVYYARNIADKERNSIADLIKKELRCVKLDVDFIEDVNLVAGFVVRHNSVRMDYSVAGIIEHRLTADC